MLTNSLYPNQSTNSSASSIDEILTKYKLLQQQQQSLEQQNSSQQVPNAITDLESFMGSLTHEQRRAVESSPDYQNIKMHLFERFLVFLISTTPDGSKFITGMGRKVSQDLYDAARTIVTNYDKNSRNEYDEMRAIIQQQSNEIQDLKKRVMQVSQSSQHNEDLIDLTAPS